MQGVLLAAVLFGIVVGAALITASGMWWLPSLASNWGSIDTMLIVTLVVTGAAFVAVNGVLAYFVFRYRGRGGQRAAFIPDNPRLEKALIAITALGIALLLGPGLFVYSRLIQAPHDALTVEVVAQQWAWSYRYPGQDGVLGRAAPELISSENPFGLDLTDPHSYDDVLVFPGGQLHLPVGKPVVFKLRSKDVIHSFYVPQFRVKMDAVPGMVTQTWVTPTKTGTFQVACAELCGIGHYGMVSAIVVESREEFEAWLGQQPTVAQTMGLP
jgi:cytochrome c oxidase subunit 2